VTTVEIVTPAEIRTAQEAAKPLPERAKGHLSIRSQDQYECAGTFLRELGSVLKQADDAFDPIIKKAHEAHKEALAQKKKTIAPLSEADVAVRRAMAAYLAEQERERQKAEREAQEAQRKAAAELERAEQLKTAEARERARERAAAEEQKAIQALEVVTAPKPEAEGISGSKHWSAEVHDLHALVRFISLNPGYLNLIEPNMPALNGLAKVQKEEFNLPGVRSKSEHRIAVR